MKAKVLKIELSRAEGPREDCGKMIVVYDFYKADQQLRQWAETAPAEGGYDKIDFAVVYEKDGRYEGRYDLKHYSIEMPDLAGHIHGELEWLAGLAKHPWCGEEKYHQLVAHYEKEGLRKTAQEILDEFQTTRDPE